MDVEPAVLIFTPILLPIAKNFGMHPVHFGIMMIMNLGIGNITPPIGSALFSGCSIADVDMEEMIKQIMPFYLAIIIALLIVMFKPELSLFYQNLSAQFNI